MGKNGHIKVGGNSLYSLKLDWAGEKGYEYGGKAFKRMLIVHNLKAKQLEAQAEHPVIEFMGTENNLRAMLKSNYDNQQEMFDEHAEKLLEKGGNVTTMPIIARITTKPLHYTQTIGDRTEAKTMPSEKYDIVAIEEMDLGKKLYITNKWYKEYKRIPLVIIEDVVDKVEMIKAEGEKMANGGELKEWEFVTEIPKREIDLNSAKEFAKEKLKLPEGTTVEYVFVKDGWKVQYEIQHELRNWGVKDVSIDIKRIWGDMEVELIKGEFPNDDTETDYVEFDTTDLDTTQSFRRKGEEDKWLMKTELPKGCSPENPTRLVIDFDKKEIEVSFVNESSNYAKGGEMEVLEEVKERLPKKIEKLQEENPSLFALAKSGEIKIKTPKKEYTIEVGDVSADEATKRVRAEYPNFTEFEYKRIQYKKRGKKGEFLTRIEPQDVLDSRWQKKKDRIRKLSDNIKSLRNNVTRDLSSEDEKTFLSALIVAIMDKTGERIGNDESADNGHYGVTGFRQKHVSVKGDNVEFDYVGKSGVKHEKMFSDEKIAKGLKRAMKDGKGLFVFTTSEGQRVRASQVNEYLSKFGVTAKDIRGYSANKWTLDKLKEVKPEDTDKKRKRQLNVVLKQVAAQVGHGAATLKKHYLMPEVVSEWIDNGKLFDITKAGYVMKKGGEIKSEGGTTQVHSTEEMKRIADTILQQIPVRTRMYVGAHQYIFGEKDGKAYLRFKASGAQYKKGLYITIFYNEGMDWYEVKGDVVFNYKHKEVGNYEMVHNDQLSDFILKITEGDKRETGGELAKGGETRKLSEQYADKIARKKARRDISKEYHKPGDPVDFDQPSENWRKYALPDDTKFLFSDFAKGGTIITEDMVYEMREWVRGLAHNTMEEARRWDTVKNIAKHFKISEKLAEYVVSKVIISKQNETEIYQGIMRMKQRDEECRSMKGMFAKGGEIDDDDKVDEDDDYELAKGGQAGVREVVFIKKVNPRVKVIVKVQGSHIIDITNEAKVHFPFHKGQMFQMNVQEWARVNGYSMDGKDLSREEKIFGVKVSDIPQGHEWRMIYPNKFRAKGGAVGDKTITDFIKALEESGIITDKNAHKNKKFIETIRSIVSLSEKGFSENKNNRTVVIIYREYKDWIQSYKMGKGGSTGMYVENCERCGKPTEGHTIMSMFNQDIICMPCKDEERKHPDYKKATDAELEALKGGERNFKGIGYEKKEEGGEVSDKRYFGIQGNSTVPQRFWNVWEIDMEKVRKEKTPAEIVEWYDEIKKDQNYYIKEVPSNEVEQHKILIMNGFINGGYGAQKMVADVDFAKGGAVKIDYDYKRIGILPTNYIGDTWYHAYHPPIEVYKNANNHWVKWTTEQREKAMAKYVERYADYFTRLKPNNIGTKVPELNWRQLPWTEQREMAVGLHNDLVNGNPILAEGGLTTEDIITRYNLHGKGIPVKFKNDQATYYTKNISPDRKSVFVTAMNGFVIKNKKIADIVSIENKPLRFAGGGKTEGDVTTSNGAKGGMLDGPSHAEGGIKTYVKANKDFVEVEGGESIINKHAMAMEDKVICEGTPAGVASAVNQLAGNGVKFADNGKCKIVKK